MYIPLSLPRKALLRQWSFLVMTDALVESVLAVEVSARFSTLPAPRKMNEKRRLFKEEQQRKKALFSHDMQLPLPTWNFFPHAMGPWRQQFMRLKMSISGNSPRCLLWFSSFWRSSDPQNEAGWSWLKPVEVDGSWGWYEKQRDLDSKSRNWIQDSIR